MDGGTIEVQVLRDERRFHDGEWSSVVLEVSLSAMAAIQQATEAYLGVIPVNWVDGSGGHGDLVLSIQEATLLIRVVRGEKTKERTQKRSFTRPMPSYRKVLCITVG